jgi:hypothetical protein
MWSSENSYCSDTEQIMKYEDISSQFYSAFSWLDSSDVFTNLFHEFFPPIFLSLISFENENKLLIGPKS